MKPHNHAAPLIAVSLAAMLVSGLLPTTADAQECVTADYVITRVRHDAPAAQISSVSGEQAARLSAGISHLIGQDVPEGGSYLIAHEPAALTSYVVRFVDGCATHHGWFPERLVRTWLDGSPA